MSESKWCCDDCLTPPWLPLSLWCTSPPRWTGRRSCRACSSASSTKPACGRARGSPADDPAGIGVDHEGDVDEAGPCRDIGEVGEPENVRPWRLELAVDVIQRAWRGLVADRGLDRFAADNPLQTHVPHQSRHRATGNIEAFALELPPDLAHAIDPEVLIEHAPNLDLQRSVLPGAGRQLGRIAPLGDMGVVGRGGDRQDLADRLDPRAPRGVAAGG